MIVYGDPSFRAPLSELLATLEAHRRASEAAPDDPDAARAWLIAAGQVEQAVADASGDSLLAMSVTDVAAAAFLRAVLPRAVETARSGDLTVLRTRGDASPSPSPEGLAAALPPPSEPFQRLATNGLAHTSPDDRTAPLLNVKVPEGFAFYALYPEQYAAAAARWADDHEDALEDIVAVVGVRSIGTSLSAVVTAGLNRRGWRVHRFTVRPTGHPFERTTEVFAGQVRGAAWALVVDEGPGQSGSSMAAVAAALERAGVAPERIAFLPGHGGEPGGAASEAVRERWARTPRCVVPTDELRWGGLPLTDVLAEQTRALCGAPAEALVSVEDFGGGLWRRHIYGPDASGWPAAYAPFERPKYRIRVGSAGPALLWAFRGLAEVGPCATGTLRRDDHLANVMAVTPAGSALGWVAFRWVDGTPLAAPADATPETLAHVGRYIRSAAGFLMTPAEVEEGRARLAEMLYWNVWEGLGEAEAGRARAWSERIASDIAALPDPLRDAYGDGRLAPHEWIRTPEGRLVKTDAAGHDADHTCVGRQPVLWDLAGALVEWDLIGDDRATPLLSGFGGDIPDGPLRWYATAYAAFRLGMAVMCAEIAAGSGDTDEAARLNRATDGYRGVLHGLLPQPSY